MVRTPSAASKPPCAAFHSHPTDLELVNSYLRPFLETGEAAAFIHVGDVYAADPADLTRQFAPAVAQDGERAWYFFTPLRHKSVRGKRKARTVATGEGCWHNEAKSKPVYTAIHGKRQIGYRQSFSFVNKEGGSRVRTGWLMMELRILKDDAGEGARAEEENALGNIVLCKVYRSPRNPEPSGGVPAPALKEEEAADGDGESSAATADDVDDDDSSDAPGPTKKSDEPESSEATVAAPPGREEKAAGDEYSAEASAASPARKRKAPDDEGSGAAAAPRRASPGARAPPAAEIQCPHCGTHLAVTLKVSESKSETEIAKGEPGPGASDAAPRGEARGAPPEKKVRFHQFL